jgi:archaellum component FlaG (FlaF/FlaG flagellin family)
MNKRVMQVTAVFLCFLTFVAAIYALSAWHMDINWSSESTQFEVYKDSGASQLWASPASLSMIIQSYPNTTTVDFWIKNIGNVAIDITNTTQSYSNCTATWTLPLNIPVAGTGQATLILTIVGSGSYSFDFASHKHT